MVERCAVIEEGRKRPQPWYERPMRLGPLLAASVLLAARSAAADDFDLSALLQRTAAFEVERATTTCRWIETTRLDELDGKGKITGSVFRTFSVTSRGPETLSRTKTSERVEGKVSGLLREERPPPKGDPKERLSPFHPEARPFFDLALGSRDEHGVVVTFTPKEKSERRMGGSAQLDPATGRVLSMSAKPSKLMAMLDSLTLNLQFAPGPCGNLPHTIDSEGSGGFLFFKIRFKSRTELSGLERVTAP